MRAIVGRTGKDSIQTRIAAFDPTKGGDKMLKAVAKLLHGLSLAEIEEISKTLAIFYAWAKCNSKFEDYD